MKRRDCKYYKENIYNKEQYMLEIFNRKLNSASVTYNKDIKVLYKKAKEESKKGNESSIWELKRELIP